MPNGLPFSSLLPVTRITCLPSAVSSCIRTILFNLMRSISSTLGSSIIAAFTTCVQVFPGYFLSIRYRIPYRVSPNCVQKSVCLSQVNLQSRIIVTRFCKCSWPISIHSSSVIVVKSTSSMNIPKRPNPGILETFIIYFLYM